MSSHFFERMLDRLYRPGTAHAKRFVAGRCYTRPDDPDE